MYYLPWWPPGRQGGQETPFYDQTHNSVVGSFASWRLSPVKLKFRTRDHRHRKEKNCSEEKILRMAIPAAESEAPELNRGEYQYKELIPPHLIQINQSNVDLNRPDLRTVHSHQGFNQADLEVNQLTGHGTLPSHQDTYRPDQYQPSYQGTFQSPHETYQQSQYQSSQYPPSHKVYSPNHGVTQTEQHEMKVPDQQNGQRRRICGLAWPTVVFLVILGLVVIGASVGGAVGGTAAQ
jgi:hypothetical protein